MVKNFGYFITVIGFIFTFSYGQKPNGMQDGTYANISFLLADPQGEFSRNVTNNGYGFNLDFGWNIYNGPLAVGADLIGLTYGRKNREVPYSYFVSKVYLTETTESSIGLFNPYLKGNIKLGDFSIFLKLFAGFQILTTETKIKNDDQKYNQNDDDQPEYIARSNNASDGTFNYGYGFGFRFPIFYGEDGPLFINLELKWSQGGEAEYLNAGKEGSIVISDASDGPVTTTFYPDKSETDLFNISIGIGF